MSVEHPVAHSNEDNFYLLDQACMLLRAADDILLNECSELFHLVYTCENKVIRKDILNQLDLLYAGVSRAHSILQTLSKAERESWSP